MKAPVFVKAERFDLGSLASKIKAIRDGFDQYLDSYPVKSARSKHSLMGPVGKVLQEARSGRWDAESLTGYALNIHLSNPRTRGFIDAGSNRALREAIGKLMDLLKESPPSAHDKIVDQIDYGLYFLRRAKSIERLDKVRRDFVTFLRDRYGMAAELAKAWGGKPGDYGEDFERIRYPSAQQFREAKGQKKTDIADFAKQAEMKGYELPEEEEE